MNRRLEVPSQLIHARSRIYTKLAALHFIEILEGGQGLPGLLEEIQLTAGG
jgi:hypothetical protein